MTLASLVEKETAVPAERPIVAAVYLNRLKIGMGMQADPTVIYALQRAGRYDGNLRRDDLSFDSPYNTYRYAGLPPGPIASPGLASLEAAVAPARRRLPVFREPQRRVARLRAHARGAQRQRQAISGAVLPGAARGRAGRGEEQASLVQADVGLAGSQVSLGADWSDAARANPAIEFQPVLERAAPPQQL